ncbi:DUF948 domain-containing protein [Microbispora cellulosiformans]|uniref:DUF948 domain-containing protein n=1 Tax=Microbispora cellulosiformans TaxID=2614688 RepID=A0A5J5JWQ2_9ACTN|nr:DUF948 domain-containing protein [Microbispora cellulosiformans]KAA9374658.1 DUF948 domain-containing protein [Microbispora cellulosiformans]
MLTAGELAGLVVAIFWAILVCFMVVVLVRLARLLTETRRSVAELSDRLGPLLDDMSHTVTEANRRLVAAETISDNMRDVSGNMVRITGVASTLFAGPVLKIAAFRDGFRLALARRAARRAPARRVARGGPRTGDRIRERHTAERVAEPRAIGRGRG